jgi:hypothetical protein
MMAVSQALRGGPAAAPPASLAAARRGGRARPLSRARAGKKGQAASAVPPEPPASTASAPGPATPRRDTRVLRSQLAALSQDLMAYEPQSFPLDMSRHARVRRCCIRPPVRGSERR